MPDKIPYLRIFISSHGDVNDERKIALDVVEQLIYRPTFRGKAAFRVNVWGKHGADQCHNWLSTQGYGLNRQQLSFAGFERDVLV